MTHGSVRRASFRASPTARLAGLPRSGVALTPGRSRASHTDRILDGPSGDGSGSDAEHWADSEFDAAVPRKLRFCNGQHGGAGPSSAKACPRVGPTQIHSRREHDE